MRKSFRTLARISCGTLLVCAASFANADANIAINNVDPPGVGFNDPTPALPVGGNVGVTVGEQRLIAYRYALDLWGARLDSVPTIVVQGSFAGLPCNAGGGVLAQAGALQIFADFDNAPIPATWFGAALANAIAGEDFYALSIGVPPGEPDPGPFAPPFNDEIIANFNGNVGQANCVAGPGWYYGLDNNPGPGQIDFLNTFMHEVAHGLGFQNFMDDATGQLAGDMQDIYTTFSFDNTAGLTHAEMSTDAERQASVINTGNVVWIGNTVTAEAPNVLDDRQFMEIYAPPAIAGEIDFAFANFGPAPTPINFIGEVVQGEPNNGCTVITNDAAIAGKIALLDRGVCAFTIKAANAQAAGATAVIIANNVGSAIALGGSDPNIVVPTVGIGLEDRNTIVAELANDAVFVRLATDPSQLAGADEQGRVRLNAPNPVQPGSSISHYDPAAVPNLLMEPAITGTLEAATNVDLTDDLFDDIGWSVNFQPNLPALGADCQAAPPTDTIEVLGCPTNVQNIEVAGVCTLADVVQKQVNDCVGDAGNHGDATSCVASSLNNMKRVGLISKNDQGEIESCVAGATVP
jgi:hypothetical protein